MRRVLTACFCAFITAASLSAQTVPVQSRIVDIDISRFPTVELQVSVTSTSTSEHPALSGVHLDENGIPQRIEYFDCPRDSVRLSVAILLDRSASMARIGDREDPDSTKMREAVKAIRAFLDLLGPQDESALFSFSTQELTLRNLFTVEQDFTFDAQRVKGALVPIVARGGTRLWEAIIEAVKLLEPRRGRRALIVLTDGRNQYGEAYHTPAIAAAVDAGIPVYTIGLGIDADIGALAGFAAATGGRFFFAPEATDLSEVFSGLAGTLITDACVLRYTSSNPCLDGSLRNIDLTLVGNGFATVADSFYSVSLQLSPVTLEILGNTSVTARDTIHVPITLAEQFPTRRPLTCYMTVDYERNLMQFVGVNSDGTMTQGSPPTIVEGPPGVLEISNVDFFPFLPTGTLCELLFLGVPRANDTTARFEVHDAEVRSACPTSVTARGASITVKACEDVFTLGDTTLIVLPGDGSVTDVPLRIQVSSPPGTPFSLSVVLDYTGRPYEIVGVETRGTLSAEGGVIMEQIAAERVEFKVRGTNSESETVLLFVRVRVRKAQREPVRTELPVSSFEASGNCIVDTRMAGGGNWSRFLIDGICEPVLRMRPRPDLSNHPNPFSPGTAIRFSMRADGPVLLQVMDSGGRIVATLLDAWMSAGEYQHRFEGRDLPAGEYYAVCTTAEGQTVRRMLLVK